MKYKVLLENTSEHIATPSVSELLRLGEKLPLIVGGEEALYLVTNIDPTPESEDDTLTVGTAWVKRVT